MSLTLLFAAATLLAVALAAAAIRGSGGLAAKLGACLAACLFMPLAYGSLLELMGRPKPASQEWWLSRTAEAGVLASSFEEGRAIHLWLRLPGTAEPRAYRLPWSQKLAEALQTAEREALAQGTGVRMRLPFEATLDDLAPMVWVTPQPAMPTKNETAPPAEIYRRPAG
jgi:hypothetical protein